MQDSLPELTKAWKKAQDAYQAARKNLEMPQPPELLSSIAQAANDAWLEFKRIETQIHNYEVLQRGKELYDYY